VSEGVGRICVYAGSSAGADDRFEAATRELGGELGRRGIGVVYGGGNVGLMGALADSALAAGAEVIGVIPEGVVDKEGVHSALSDLRVVSSMHERKATMAGLADAFIAVPGGLGTMEEAVEVLTWTQLGVHAKPVALLNVAGYWEPLITMLDTAVAQAFLRPEHREMLLVDARPAALISSLGEWRAPRTPAWIDPSQT
jgi:hypothetical protein